MREDIIAEALTWDGTPYHHHARVKGVGVDCAQLVVGVALGVGIINDNDLHKVPNYPIQWHLHNREEKLLEVLTSFGCEEVSKEETLPGDIITFQFGRVSSHLGIMVNETQMIHAQVMMKRVVVNTLQALWLDRWSHTFRFPGVK